MRRLKIAIIASGRFHLLDLARELAVLGHDVLFYSAVPPWQTARFGLRPENTRWLGPVAAGLIWTTRRYGRKRQELWDIIARRGIDRLAARAIEPCDVVIGLSGLCIESFESARRRFGAKVVVERGSLHIRSQKQILDQLQTNPIGPESIKLEERSYELADRISIPSRAAELSFLKHGFSSSQLLRNPYGTSLELFRSTPTPPRPLRALMVGAWSYQKGCDLLVKAWEQCDLDAELLHVGAIADCPFPVTPRIRHVPFVPQAELPQFYAQSHVFVLASRQEGLAVVQAQALASGLPLVCTDATGGQDLAELLDVPVYVAEAGNVDSLVTALRRAFGDVGKVGAARGAKSLDKLSWSSYGRRYSDLLQQLSSKDRE